LPPPPARGGPKGAGGGGAKKWVSNPQKAPQKKRKKAPPPRGPPRKEKGRGPPLFFFKHSKFGPGRAEKPLFLKNPLGKRAFLKRAPAWARFFWGGFLNYVFKTGPPAPFLGPPRKPGPNKPPGKKKVSKRKFSPRKNFPFEPESGKKKRKKNFFAPGNPSQKMGGPFFFPFSLWGFFPPVGAGPKKAPPAGGLGPGGAQPFSAGKIAPPPLEIGAHGEKKF